MDLYEYEAKRVFADFGIVSPPSARITKPEDLRNVHLGWPVVLKCQVLMGGRGKAGGIKFAANLAEGEAIAAKLLPMVIKGSKTESLLVEPRVDIEQELYLALTIDRERGCPVFIAAFDGGIEIESNPNIVKMPVTYPYSGYVGRNLAKALGLTGSNLVKVAAVANNLFACFEKLDLDLAEINPLVITKGGDVIALDGKMTVNDDALGRQSRFAGWAESHLCDLPSSERKARLLGLNLVQLGGNVGIICNGAGLTMATMDLVKGAGGEPANFLDAGGGSDKGKTLAALELVNENPKVSVILLNILGGITACDEVAAALVEFRKAHPERKLIVRLRGNNQDVAAKMLAQTDTKLYADLEEAVKAAVAAAKPPVAEAPAPAVAGDAAVTEKEASK